MRRLLLVALIWALAACGGPTSPSLRSEVLTGSLSSVDHPMAADHKIYSAQPPTNHEPLASNVTSDVTSISASVVAGTYYILLSQEQVVIGPDKGTCGCVDDFTLTLTYP